MKPFTALDIINITNGYILCGDKDLECINYSKDTRDINPNDVYVGIKGANFDGNTFYMEAFEKGAGACILDKEYEPQIDLNKINNKTIILVENTLTALAQIASAKRDLYDIPVIAITGSVGKTSVKDVVSEVLSKDYKVLKTKANFNNQIGLPLTILRLKDHNALVVELGTDHLGEISLLSKIAKPTIAIITNVGTAHIESFKTRKNILKGKLEITDGLKKDGILIINNDNDLLHDLKFNNVNIVTCGIDNESDIKATALNGSKFIINYKSNQYDMQTTIPTKGFIYNSLMAFAVGSILNIPIKNIKQGLLNYRLTENRMELINNLNGIIINDTYNANYDSMINAIDYLKTYSNKKTIAVLGDMLELGSYAVDIHEKLGEYVSKSNIDYLITIGKLSNYIGIKAVNNGMDKNKVKHFKTNEESFSYLKSIMDKDYVTLVKASNSMKFINIVNYLKKEEN